MKAFDIEGYYPKGEARIPTTVKTSTKKNTALDCCDVITYNVWHRSNMALNGGL